METVLEKLHLIVLDGKSLQECPIIDGVPQRSILEHTLPAMHYDDVPAMLSISLPLVMMILFSTPDVARLLSSSLN